MEQILPTEVLITLHNNLKKCACCVYSYKNPELNIEGVLNREKKYSFERYDYFIKIKQLSNISNLYLLEIEKVPVQDSYRKRKLNLFIFASKTEKIIYCFSNASTSTLEKVFHSFMIDVFYKSVTRCYITSIELRDSLKIVLDNTQYSAYSKWWTAKERFGSEIKFEKESIPALECFEVVKYKSLYVNWIQLRIITQKKDSFKINLSRNGNIFLNNPEFLEFSVALLNLFAKFSNKKTSFMDNKSFSSEKLPELIELKYTDGVFNELDNRRELIGKIKAYEKCNYSIIHGVNPHIYMLITDLLDHSSFTLRSKGSDTLLLIPHLFATDTAINRFVHYLNENFQEYKELDDIEVKKN